MVERRGGYLEHLLQDDQWIYGNTQTVRKRSLNLLTTATHDLLSAYTCG
ncbi:hypothetical protein [Nostoc sp. ChiVER01]|nr:hypothetical protein [Nostoc sp. ChiVER01]MDZ8225417.1 hypothetical protein [Nostoc sp. ChiVER01]